jgi:transposase
MIYVGIDWAATSHTVCVLDEQGGKLAQIRIPDTGVGVKTLQELFTSHVETSEEVVIGIETSHGLLVQALAAANYSVYAINPKAASRYRERHGSSGKKSDPGDAQMLADLVRTDRHNHQLLRQDSSAIAALQALARTHKRLIWDRQRHLNQLRSTLREYYPGALIAFGADLGDPGSLAVLARAPTPVRGRALSVRQLVGILRRAGRERGLEARAAKIQAALRATAWEQPADVAVALGVTVSAQVAVLGTLDAQITELADAMTVQMQAHPDAELIASLPGLGVVLSARVLAEFGDDPTAYSNSKARKCYAGTAPVTRASGRVHQVGRRKATNSWLIDACMRWAFCSLQPSPGARAYYDEQRSRGKGHQTALRALANRWVGILHGCLRHRSPYDERTAWPSVVVVDEATKPLTASERAFKEHGSDHGSDSTLQESA